MNLFLERYGSLGETFDPKKIDVKQSLRVNTIKMSDAQLISRINARLEKIPYLDHGYYFTSMFTVGAMPEHFLGYIYIQDAASQIPAEVLDPKATDVVLDMAAAPGGKTSQLAAIMKNQGTIIALDANNARLPAIKNNLERCGVKNCLVYKKDAIYADDLKMEFDKILLDAPCSGNFTIEKGWFDKRKVSELAQLTKMQRKLLETAVSILKTKGTLVYSTCSLEPEENEENIDWLLKKYPELKLEKIEKEIGEPGLTIAFGKEFDKTLALTKRMWPHKTGTQGFFVAKIKKN